jgi:multiple sugar transport system ATP-binding protein
VLASGTQLPLAEGSAGADGQSVIFGTRPEHLSLGDGQGDGAIAVEVVTVEPTGADTFVACRHHGTEMSAVFRERHEFRPGSTIHLRPDMPRTHLFDAATGQRLGA